MAQPPFPAPLQIRVTGVLPGEFGADAGGWRSTLQGEVSVRIDGDTAGVFSVVGLERFALRLPHDPDLPPGTHSLGWESVAQVDGTGPIGLRTNEALVVTVGFVCPAGSTQKLFEGSAVILSDGQALGSIPIEAEVASIVGINLGHFATLGDREIVFSDAHITFPGSATGGETAAQFVLIANVSDGGTRQLDPLSVSWGSANHDVARIDAHGLATGVGVGTTNIIAAFAGFPPSTAQISVS